MHSTPSRVRRGGGGGEATIIKGPTNNNDTAAVNNYFSHPGRLSKNIFNQYGFAIGGPIWIPKVVHGKNKLFFFVDYMGTKRRQYAATTNLTLPTPAMRTGDFSATTTAIYDPLTGN